MEQEELTGELVGVLTPEQEQEKRLEEYRAMLQPALDDPLPAPSPRQAGEISRKRVLESIFDTFELLGGTPGMAQWALAHPTEFYRMYTKVLPSSSQNLSQHNNTTIIHVLPKTGLDE